MKPLTSTISFAATLTLANAAVAQHTRIICEASGDYGLTWHDLLTVWPGQRVDVRVRIEMADSRPYTIIGFSGATYQPTLSGWERPMGDAVVPFDFPGLTSVGVPTTETAYDGAHVVDAIGVTGRIAPFGSGRQGNVSPSGVITAFHDPGNVLRFAGSRNTTMFTNLAWGIGTAQYPLSLSGSFYSRYLSPTTFRYAVELSPRSTTPRTLTARVPIESVHGQVAKYYICSACTALLNMPVFESNFHPASITVRPRCHADLAGNFQLHPTDPAAQPRPLPDGSVTIEDLLFFLKQFDLGSMLADLDDGGGSGVPDAAVTIEDLLFFLAHFESGC